MLRAMFVLASTLAVLGGLTAGSAPQQLAAGLVAVALLAHHVLVLRAQRRRPSPATVPVQPALGVVGHLDR